MAGSSTEITAIWVRTAYCLIGGQAGLLTTSPVGLKSRILGLFGGSENAETRETLKEMHVFFPHSDDSGDHSLIYHDALEFLRPGAYLESTARIAMSKLLMQIRSRKTNHLIKALHNRTRLDLEDFFFQLMTNCMGDIERIYDTLYRQDRSAVLSPSLEEAQSLIHTLHLIAKMIQDDDPTCRVILQAGLLDMLLQIYVIFPAFSHSTIDGAEPWMALLQTCQHIIKLLLNSTPNHSLVIDHPISVLWPDAHGLPPPYTSERQDAYAFVTARCVAWQMAPRACIKRRVGMIHVGCLWSSNVTAVEDVQACADLVEFIQPQFYDQEIVQIASLAILKHILVSGDAARHLITIIARCTPYRITLIISNIVRLLAEHFTSQTRDLMTGLMGNRNLSTRSIITSIDDASFFGLEKELLFEEVTNARAALPNMLKFATRLAGHGLVAREAMMEAGALALVLFTFSNQDFHAQTLLAYAKQRGYDRNGEVEAIPLDIINGEAATLASLVSTYSFRQNWSSQAYRARRVACARFLKALFGNVGEQGGSGELGERYRWMRALYSKIVATPTS